MPCLEALDTVIGLSRTVCNCFEDTPANYDNSDSGYYMDELPGFTLKLVGSAEDCEQGGLWDIMAKARDTAIMNLKGDLLTQLGSNYKKTLESYTYQIGSTKGKTTYNPGTVYAGMRLAFRPIHNGYFTINNIKLIFNVSDTIQVHLFNNLSDTPLYSFTVTTTANVASPSAALGYTLPMYQSGEQLEYYLVYELPASGLPLNNDICAPCLHWNIECCDTPCWGNRTVRDQTWNNNLMVGGIKGDSWTELDEQTGIGNKNGGIVLNISFHCDYEEIICGNLEFTGQGLPMAIAAALQFKADANAYEQALSSTNINRFQMLDRDRTMQLINKWNAEYNNRVLWLSQNIDVSENGCYFCEPQMRKTGILI